MRKFIASILSFIMVLSFTTPIYAYNSTGSEATDINAETPAGQDTLQGHKSEYEQYENVDGASTEVYASRESTFTVKLPKVIILDGESGTAEYTIQINGDVIDEDVISVEPNNTEIELNDVKGNRAPIKATVNQDKTTVSGAEISEDLGTSIEGSITAEQLKAGAWEGKLSFNINIKRETDREYIPFEITATNRAMIGYTDETTDLVIPATFQDEDGTWYRVTSIGNRAFYNCKNLKSVVMPEGITSIGNYAFAGSASSMNLESVIIPNSVIEIRDGAFSFNLFLNVVVPDSVIEIGEKAFDWVKHIYYNGTATGSPWGAKAMN